MEGAGKSQLLAPETPGWKRETTGSEAALSTSNARTSDASLSKCRREALATVIAMLACSVLLAAALTQAPRPVLKVARNPWTLLFVTVLVMFALGSSREPSPTPCLFLITLLGALLFICAPVVSSDGAVDYSAISRALVNVILILLLAVVGGYVTDFYASWGPFLCFVLLALFVGCLTFWIIPPSSVSPTAYNIFSAVGSLLFAIWTVKDVRECAGNNPTEAAIAIFIDLVNLLQFTH